MPMNPRLLRPLASGFSPKRLASLFAWYDANSASSITIETGVKQWDDLSGNAHNLIQTITNNQPAYGSVTLNGKATITFDGTNDTLRTAAWTLNQPYQTFVVVRLESTFTQSRNIVAHNIGGSRSGELRYPSSGTQASWFSGVGSGVAVNVAAGVREAFNGYDAVANGASSRLSVKNFSNTGDGGSNNSNALSVASGGPSNNIQDHGDVSIAEIIIYSRALSTTETATVRNYLAGKWGISYT
jgi:uncharacterized protein YukE